MSARKVPTRTPRRAAWRTLAMLCAFGAVLAGCQAPARPTAWDVAATPMFALSGAHGQVIYVDPTSRLVMVHTAVSKLAVEPNKEELALWLGAVDALGGLP